MSFLTRLAIATDGFRGGGSTATEKVNVGDSQSAISTDDLMVDTIGQEENTVAMGGIPQIEISLD